MTGPLRGPRPAIEGTAASPAEDRGGPPVRVAVVGPGVGSRGGMASVLRIQEQALGDRDDVDLTVVRSYVDGPAPVRIARSVAAVGQVLGLVARRRVDLVHVHVSQRLSAWRKGVVLTVARLSGIPTILHTHGSVFLDWFDRLPAPARAVLQRLLAASRVVVLSEATRDDYARRLGVDPAGLVVLPNPVARPEQVPHRTRAQPVTMTFLGRFGARKGIDDLLRAVATIPAPLRARLRLVAAGDGEVDRVRAAVAAGGLDDVVTVSGWLSPTERDALLARAEVLVLPSSHEGLPMAVLEAMSWALAPVVTPVGGLAEVVRDGRNGRIVPVGDPDALAAVLTDLLTDPEQRRALGARARDDVRAYGAETWADRLVALYRTVLSRTPAPDGTGTTPRPHRGRTDADPTVHR